MSKSGRTYWLIIAVVLTMMAVSVERSFATPLTISNWDFDAVAVADGTGILGIDGWTGTGISGTRNPSSITFNDDYNDDNVAFVNSGSIYQDISSLNGSLGVLNADHLYTLTVDVGYQTSLSCSALTTCSYTIELLAGGTPFLSASGTGIAGEWNTITIDRLASISDGALLGQNLVLSFSTTGDRRTHFDNVRLTNNDLAAIPEPATLLLLGSGLLGVAVFSKKKFKA